MRITNQIMTNNSLNNLKTNYNRLSILDNQFSTEKKITRPSQDPVVAVRALKLRSTCDELTQYIKKNIPDAKAWMEITEGSLDNIVDRLSDVETYCTQGASDTNNSENRQSIIDTLNGFKDSILDEGSTKYGNRYVYSGCKTDTNLVFDEATSKQYTISENLSYDKIEAKTVVVNEVDATADLDTLIAANAVNNPAELNVHRLRLSYGSTDATAPTVSVNGTALTNKINIITSSSNEDKYTVAADEINYIPETGELILGENVYNAMKSANSIDVSYSKTEFQKSDLRPEHYFDCASNGVTYKKSQETIQYEVNFNQKLIVNTEGKDAIKHDYIRDIDELASVTQDLIDAESTKTQLEAKLSDPAYSDEKYQTQINSMIEDVDNEIALKKKLLQEGFSKLQGTFSTYEDNVSALRSSSGARTTRLELIETRAKEQLTSYEDLKSSNEDVDLEEVAVKISSAELVYNASLMSAAKVIRQSLLDFL